jgi:hypothetical protein
LVGGGGGYKKESTVMLEEHSFTKKNHLNID